MSIFTLITSSRNKQVRMAMSVSSVLPKIGAARAMVVPNGSTLLQVLLQ